MIKKYLADPLGGVGRGAAVVAGSALLLLSGCAVGTTPAATPTPVTAPATPVPLQTVAAHDPRDLASSRVLQAGKAVPVWEVFSEGREVPLPAGRARIFVFRPADAGAPRTALGVFINGQYLTSLRPLGYSLVDVCPGAVDVVAGPRTGGDSAPGHSHAQLSLSLKAGEQSLVKITRDPGGSVALAPMTQVHSEAELAGAAMQVHALARISVTDCTR